MVYRQHKIEYSGDYYHIRAAGKNLVRVETLAEARRLIDIRMDKFPNKPLGWW